MDGNKYSHDVFISFSFKDQSLAENIVNILSSTYGISCWICTRDIDGGKRYKKLIPEAIDNAKVVVFLQSSSSIESKEIPKEIGMAFDADKTIIPFKLDDAKLTGDLRYDLYGVEYIDATVPTFDERVGELAKAIKKVLGTESQNTSIESSTHQKLVSTPNVLPKMIFCGRENVLSEIHSKFQDGERVIFLHGIGGIGKTQIAKQYAKQYKKDYDTVVYATYNGSLKEMIVSETPFTIEPALIRYTLSNGTQEDDEAFFARKLDFILKETNEKTLIIIDNFDVDSDDSLSALMNGKYHLLITTRCDYSRFYPTIRINPIDSIDSLIEIFMNNYQGDDVEKDDPKLVELIELVNRHTYTIELVAQHMENSGQTPAEMIVALKERGITSLDETFQNSDMKTQIAYENLLKMFKVFSLSEEERQILMYLSLMPIEGVNVKDFKKWANLKSSRVLRNLENRSWIIRNTDGIAMHPIIRSVIKHEMPANEDNCYDFINRFSESIEESTSWHFKKIAKDKYGAVAKRLLSIFKEITPKTELLYYNSEVLLSFAVDPEYAVDLAKRIYDYYNSNCSENDYLVGRSAFKLGWVYAYNTHLLDAVNNALVWLKRADEILSCVHMETTEEKSKLTQTKVNLAKMYLMLFAQTKQPEHYLLAKEYAEYNVEYSLQSYKPGDPQYAKLAGAYWQLADVLLAGGEYDLALLNIEKSLGILIPLNTENDGDSMHAINRKAAILYAMGNYEKAKPIAEKGVLGYAEYFGENHPTIVGMYDLLGDCCSALNEQIEAQKAYKKAMEIAEKLYAPGAQQIEKLKEKINKS